MKLLVIGSGGRAHALAWKLAQSSIVTEVVVAPGNAGTANEEKCRNVNIAADDIPALIRLAKDEHFDLTVVGPEAPLTEGIVDSWPENLRIWGPNAQVAQLEGSKLFAKEIMQQCNVNTATWRTFNSLEEGRRWIELFGLNEPAVVKADGLCGGKGVIVCKNGAEIAKAVEAMSEFGEAGKRFIVEDCLVGQEVSFFALCGKGGQVIPLEEQAQDYKRSHNRDKGINTGGMGCFSPVAHLTDDEKVYVVEKIIRPVVEKTGFTGFLYVGLMKCRSGIYVLEFNVRMGDPETQVLMPRLETDLAEALYIMAGGEIYDGDLVWRPESCVTVVMAEHGYPGHYEKGAVILGLDQVKKEMPNVIVFHAGTKLSDGKMLTNGGRVLNVTALGETQAEARARAYKAVEMITWGKGRTYYRTDIAV